MSDYSPFTGRHREPPAPVLVKECWRVLGPSGSPITCGIYRRADERLELICHYSTSVDALVRSQIVNDIDKAREIAEQWREAAIAKGFQELKSGPETG